MAEVSNTYSSITKVYWCDIRERVAKVEPIFASLIDELAPDKNFPLYLTYYPYGAYKGDTRSTFIPTEDGTSYRLTDPDAPDDIKKHLGYASGSAPLCMLLDKQMELFADLKELNITIPQYIYQPGDVFPLTMILNKPGKITHSPNGILSVSSGLRSTFLLPPIGCIGNHNNLKRDFKIQTLPPKRLYDHWNLFREIAQSSTLDEKWASCLLYFSEKWVTHLHNDPAWLKVKLHLNELAWSQTNHYISRCSYDLAYSVIQKNRNLKPNPYLSDTAKHIFSIASGTALGYSPAINENGLPLKLLQTAFIESYELKKYLPTIMQPAMFNFNELTTPTYYSLQYPSTFSFSPRSRKASNTLFEIQELAHLLKIFRQEFSKDDFMCYNTTLHRATKSLSFDYYHSEFDNSGLITASSKIIEQDQRFNYLSINNAQTNHLEVPFDCSFLRGCIAIKASAVDVTI